jgi:hypothetical protein
MTTKAATDPYPYRTADLEQVAPSHLLDDDLIAQRGPEGTDGWYALRVTGVRRSGHDVAGATVWRIGYKAWHGESYWMQPESMPVWRVRRAQTGR